VKEFIDSNHNEQLIDSTGFKTIWRHLHAQLPHEESANWWRYLQIVFPLPENFGKLEFCTHTRVLLSHLSCLIVVVCCAGSYLLLTPCR
jgi:hypothetical protein